MDAAIPISLAMTGGRNAAWRPPPLWLQPGWWCWLLGAAMVILHLGLLAPLLCVLDCVVHETLHQQHEHVVSDSPAGLCAPHPIPVSDHTLQAVYPALLPALPLALLLVARRHGPRLLALQPRLWYGLPHAPPPRA